MKRILIFLLFIPVFSFGQVVNIDTITYERDTILAFRTSAEYTGHFTIKADTLEGTADATIELVVADDLDNIIPSGTQPADSMFFRYSSNLIDTLALGETHSFYYDLPMSYDWVGVKITLNNVTKWYLRTKDKRWMQ